TGTFLYMAPEVMSGKPVAPSADIYAMGVVLYQSLVGDFSEAVTLDWAENIEDAVLRRVLKDCFVGDPRKRLLTAEQFAARLRAWPKGLCETQPSAVRAGPAVPLVPPSEPKGSRLRLAAKIAGIAVGALLLLGGAFLGWRYLGQGTVFITSDPPG